MPFRFIRRFFQCIFRTILTPGDPIMSNPSRLTRSTKFAWMAALLLVCVTFLIHYLVSQGGTRAHFTWGGTDWPAHAASTEYWYWDVFHDPDFSVITAMSFYPIGAYWLTAQLGRFFGSGPTEMITLLAALFLALSTAAMGLRVHQALEDRLASFNAKSWKAQGILALTLTLPVAIAIYFCVLGIGISGILRYNCYYPQLISIALAIWGSLAFKRFRGQPVRVALFTFLFCGFILPNVHLSAGLWFFAFGALILFLESKGIKQFLSLITPLVFATAVALKLNPSVTRMVRISEANGSLEMKPYMPREYGYGSAAAVALPVFLLLIWQLFRILRNQPDRLERAKALLRQNAGFLAIVAVIAGQALLLFFNQGSIYAVKKHIFVLATETLISLTILLANLLPVTHQVKSKEPSLEHPAPHVTRSWQFLLPALSLCLTFMAQVPFYTYHIDQKEVIALRNQLIKSKVFKDQPPPEKRQYPNYPNINASQQLYLAIGVIGLPGDEPTLKWFMHNLWGI